MIAAHVTYANDVRDPLQDTWCTATSTACKLFRQHSDLNAASGLLCCSGEEKDNVKQNVSSPDASSEDDLSGD